VKKLFLLTIQ
jgi:uncharacterized protein YihD (DUF1040 family)